MFFLVVVGAAFYSVFFFSCVCVILCGCCYFDEFEWLGFHFITKFTWYVVVYYLWHHSVVLMSKIVFLKKKTVFKFELA